MTFLTWSSRRRNCNRGRGTSLCQNQRLNRWLHRSLNLHRCCHHHVRKRLHHHRVQLVQLVQLKKSREGTSTTQWTSMGSMTCWIHSTLLGQHQCSVSLHQHQYSVSQCRHQCNVRRHLCPQSQHREARSAARKTARVVDDLARVAKAAEAKLLVGLLGLQPGHRTQRGHRHRSAHRETNKVCQCDG